MHNQKTKPKWRVAVLSNVKDETLPYTPDLPPDAYADFESKETIRLLRKAIESDGHETALLIADKTLPRMLDEYQPDICFNDAEGIHGNAREAQTPAMLEMMGIPYTHSRILTHGIALDKTLTKRIWRDYGLPDAKFQEFRTGSEPVSPELAYPLFVKPSREGSGMGIDENSIVENEKQYANESIT